MRRNRQVWSILELILEKDLEMEFSLDLTWYKSRSCSSHDVESARSLDQYTTRISLQYLYFHVHLDVDMRKQNNSKISETQKEKGRER